MDFELTAEEKAFKAQATAYIKEHAAKPGVINEGADGTKYVDTPARRGFMKDLAKGGYLGVSWPKEYGGKGLPAVYDYLLIEELAYQGAPQTGKGVGIIGRTLMRRGTDEQKAKFLPLILNADIEWVIGYSEPEAGSDLASMKLKATREGNNGWRLNGQKRFNTSAHFADWYFLAARTDFTGPKHQGISLFLIDLKTPGITVNAMPCIDGERTNEVFFDDVFVPDSQVIGEIGKGFYYMSEALDFERHVLFPFGTVERMYDALLDWVRTATRDGEPVRKDPHVRRTIAQIATAVEVARLHSWRVVLTDNPLEANVGSAMNKIVNSEIYHNLARLALDLIGPSAYLIRGQSNAVAKGLFQLLYLSSVLQTVGAGTNEIQRNIIARRGLGLPNPI